MATQTITTSSSSAWQLNTTKELTTQTSTISIKLNTAGKFVDKDIQITDVVTVKPASNFSISGGDVSATVTVTTSFDPVEIDGKGWAITAVATGVGTREASSAVVGSAGWIDATTSLATLEEATSSEATGTSTFYIQKAVFRTSGNEVLVSEPGYVGVGTITGGTVSTGSISAQTVLTSLDSYFNTGSSTSKDITIETKKSVTEAGYVDSSLNGTVTTSYYSIKKGSLTNQPFGSKAHADYVEMDSPAIITSTESTGWLYVNPGWYDGGKISLDTLIPDGTTAERATSDKIATGFKAYDDQGRLLVGVLAPISASSDCYTSVEGDGKPESAIGPGYLEGTQYIKAGSATVDSTTITVNVGTVTVSADSSYIIPISGMKTVSATYTPGWIDAVTSAEVTVSGTVTLTKAVVPDKTATCTVNASKSTVVTTNGGLVLHSSQESGKTYAKMTATTTITASVSGSATVTCSTAGWLPKGNVTDVSFKTQTGGDVITSSKEYYIELFAGEYEIG